MTLRELGDRLQKLGMRQPETDPVPGRPKPPSVRYNRHLRSLETSPSEQIMGDRGTGHIQTFNVLSLTVGSNQGTIGSST